MVEGRYLQSEGEVLSYRGKIISYFGGRDERGQLKTVVPTEIASSSSAIPLFGGVASDFCRVAPCILLPYIARSALGGDMEISLDSTCSGMAWADGVLWSCPRAHLATAGSALESGRPGAGSAGSGVMARVA